jgi:hypothetical protein
MSEPPQEATETKDDPVAKGVGIGCLGLLVVVAALWIVGSVSGDSGVSTYEAEKQCERFIEDRLKAPASAEFDLATTGGPVSFTSVGTVDSQNSFGAMIRNDVSCTLHLTGETWYLDAISGLAN